MRRRRTPEPEPLGVAEILRLSWPVRPPKPTGNAYLDGHNDAIGEVQAYLNGRTLGSDDDDRRRLFLQLRLELNDFITYPEETA